MLLRQQAYDPLQRNQAAGVRGDRNDDDLTLAGQAIQPSGSGCPDGRVLGNEVDPARRIITHQAPEDRRGSRAVRLRRI